MFLSTFRMKNYNKNRIVVAIIVSYVYLPLINLNIIQILIQFCQILRRSFCMDGQLEDLAK